MDRWNLVKKAWMVTVFLVILWNPQSAQGDAFRIMDQGAAASGQGSAFAAQADDPSAVYYNPAGMTQLEGVQFYGGVVLVGGNYNYTSPGGTKYQGDLGGRLANPPPMNLYLTANLNKLKIDFLKDWSVGIGLAAPFGLKVRYPKDTPFSSLDTEGSLPLLNIKPTVAYRFSDFVSFGAGLDIYTFADFAGKGAYSAKSFIPPDTELELNLRDTAIGYNLSMLVTPLRTEDGKPRLNLAFVYRSGATLNLSGQFLTNGTVSSNAAADVKLPQVFTAGMAFWPVRNKQHEWKLELDVDYADWSTFNNVDVRLSNGTTLSEPRNWTGAATVHVGTEYKLLKPDFLPEWEVAARFGYIRSQTPVPDRMFEPGVPDANFNSFSAGLGFLCKGKGSFLGLVKCDSSEMGFLGVKGIGLDVAYKNQFYESRTIDNDVRPVINGTWQTTLHAGMLNVRIMF
jgi:long-chain fatty acid transport protein